jgi:hypothetical protein
MVSIKAQNNSASADRYNNIFIAGKGDENM